MEGVHPLVMPVFFSFAQGREDLAKHTAGFSDEAVWKQFGRTSLGFHLKHIGGSVGRLMTYLVGGQLTRQQLKALFDESQPDQSLPDLLAAIHLQFSAAEEQLRKLDPATLYDPRTVGRQALPTTVLGLLVHLCEHTQRHLGQAILLATLLR